MGKVFKVIACILAVLVVVGSIGFLFMKTMQYKKSVEVAAGKITELQSKLDSVGTFTDVYTVKAAVKSGQIIQEADLILQTLPSSCVPANVISDATSIVGKCYRIGIGPGTTITSDFVVPSKPDGAIYERDVFLDSFPVGLKAGDYIDIRFVLPDGEELQAFEHRRVKAVFSDSIKLDFSEADLWRYTSMNVDYAIYKGVGLKLYATKYTDPGAHDSVVVMYPVRKEVVDIMKVSKNLSDAQRASLYNESLRTAIDAKLAFYDEPINTDGPKIAGNNDTEHSRVKGAADAYDELMKSLVDTGLQDPNAAPSTDGVTDHNGDGSVIQSQDYLDNLQGNIFEDESTIE